MLPWMWCVLLLLTRSGEVHTQTESQVVFLLGTFQNVTFSQNETVQATVSGIPATVSFLTLQFHTRHRNTTLSLSRPPGASLSATDTGLLTPLAPGQTSLSLFLTSADGGSVAGTGVTLPYGGADPVPGACSGTPGLVPDPGLQLRYNLYETTLRFAPASLSYARGGTPPPCDVATETLLYDVYRHLLPAGDLTEGALFGGLQAVVSAEGLRANASLVTTLSGASGTEVVVSSVAGRGVVYSVVVRDVERNTWASYVPAHTYACSFQSTLEGCSTIGLTSTKVFFTLAGLAGLFVCFYGHRFFKCELFCMGFAFVSFFFFILISRTTSLDHDLRLALTAVMGAVGGALLVTSWWRFGSVMVCVAVVGLILGFFVASTVFFTPLGDLEVFQTSALTFWVTFCCLVVSVSLVLVRWPREGNITTCGLAGAYCVVLAVNAYASTVLAYITLNVLKRLVNVEFSAVFTDVPFHDIDFVLITVWVVLAVCGVGLQLYRERARPFFPPSPYLLWLQERERRKTNVLDPSHHTPTPAARLLAGLRQLTHRRQPAGEHTPLLL